MKTVWRIQSECCGGCSTSNRLKYSYTNLLVFTDTPSRFRFAWPIKMTQSNHAVKTVDAKWFSSNTHKHMPKECAICGSKYAFESLIATIKTFIAQAKTKTTVAIY